MGIIINGLTDTVTAADGSLNIGGDVTIPGELSYDDVTNIDSVGVITARDGLHVAGGSLGIGDASPTKPLTVGTTTPVILLDDQSSRTLEIRGPSTTYNATVLTTSVHDLLLGTNNTERLRITSGGIIQLATDAVDFANGTGYITAKGSGDLVFRTTNSYTERLRITSSGRIGINQASPEAMLQVDYDYANSEVGLRLRAASGSGTKTWQLSEVNGNAGVFSIRNQTNSTEGLDIHGDGHVRVPTGDLRVGDNTDSNAGTKTISVGSVSSGSGGIGIFANPTNGNSFVQFGDGTSSADQYRGYMNYRHADDSLRFGTAGTDRLHLYSNGKIHLGNGYISSNNLTRLHVGWNTGGTVAGESIIAGTLGNDTTAVSALLTMKNAGNRGAQGASGGSSLAKFEFNNGTAFEIDKYGRRTLPYQPGCKLSIDTNSTGGGNHAQTGRTILPFNSTAYGYNTGNHYNLTTHTWTCPLDGKYLVILSVNVIGDNIAYIYKNGSIHSAGEFRSNPNGVWEHMEISAVVECSANDTIQPYSQMTGSGRKFNGGNQPGSYWDTLSIYYLG